jgi:hypothetical protein
MSTDDSIVVAGYSNSHDLQSGLQAIGAWNHVVQYDLSTKYDAGDIDAAVADIADKTKNSNSIVVITAPTRFCHKGNRISKVVKNDRTDKHYQG